MASCKEHIMVSKPHVEETRPSYWPHDSESIRLKQIKVAEGECQARVTHRAIFMRSYHESVGLWKIIDAEAGELIGQLRRWCRGLAHATGFPPKTMAT